MTEPTPVTPVVSTPSSSIRSTTLVAADPDVLPLATARDAAAAADSTLPYSIPRPDEACLLILSEIKTKIDETIRRSYSTQMLLLTHLVAFILPIALGTAFCVCYAYVKRRIYVYRLWWFKHECQYFDFEKRERDATARLTRRHTAYSTEY